MKVSKILITLIISTLAFAAFAKDKVAKEVMVGRKVAQANTLNCYSYQALEGQNVIVYYNSDGNSPYIQLYFGEFFDAVECKHSKTQSVCEHTVLVRNNKGQIKVDGKGMPIVSKDGSVVFKWGAKPTITTRGLNNMTHAFAEFDLESRKIFAKLNNVTDAELTKLASCPATPAGDQ